MKNTIIFLTHLHSDHTGLANFFDKKGAKIYASKIDGDIMNNSLSREDSYWQGVLTDAISQGLEEDKLSLDDHPGFKYRAREYINYTAAYPGDRIKIGEFNFEVINLEGHTPGCIGLYDEVSKIFFCGDHILGKITPNITFWGFEYGDSLGIYLENLDKVYDMDIDYLFSSHRYLVDDYRNRINEIKLHHEKRLDETRAALKKHGKTTVRTVTKNLHWDIRSKDWDDFPNSQKWFAAGEAHAHLERLRALKEVDYQIIDGVMYYYLID